MLQAKLEHLTGEEFRRKVLSVQLEPGRSPQEPLILDEGAGVKSCQATGVGPDEGWDATTLAIEP